MKRMNFLPMGAAVLLLAFTACTDEMTEVQSGELRQIVMTASDFETEDGSRTNFQITSSGAEFSWAANDTVGIFPNEGAQAYFPMTSGAGTKSANFTGGGWALKDASTYAAYYPFIGDFYLNKNAIPVDYTEQVQTGDASTAHLGAYDYMAAAPSTPKNGNVSFAFKHLGALVQLKLTLPQATTLNSVALTAENKSFAIKGKVDIMASSLGITSVTSSKDVTLEVKDIATTEANQKVTLYMMLPPVDLTGKTLKAVVKTSNGSEEVALDSKNFQAGKAYALSGSLKDPNGGAIVGNGTHKDVSIVTAGTMKKLLGDDYLSITSLKVVGPINGDDVYYLRKMFGGSNFSEADWGKLSILDLSEATIVEGGEWYYESSSSQKYYTSNNEIGDFMFYECANLQNIILPNSATSIGFRAFRDCDELTEVTIGDNVTSIGYDAFYDCDALTEVTIGDGVTSIGDDAFHDCDALTEVTIGNGVTSIGNDAFKDCDALTEVTIKNLSSWCKIEFNNSYSNPLHEGAKLYLNDKEITQLVIPEDILTIKDNAFMECESITYVTIGDGVTSIGDLAFYDCDALTEVTIGDGVTSIGHSAFYDCDALTEVTIPDGVTSIDSSAFYDCDALTKVTIPDGVTSIGYYAFSYCDALTEVTIGDGVTSINDRAFYDCNALTEVTIGDGVTSIGDDAFYDCNALTEVTIGDSVTSINDRAFSKCSINVLYCYATKPPKFDYTSYQGAFSSGVETGATLYVPARCGAIYKASNWGKLFENIVEMD